ncbi:MAG: GNAT family N-acetyltransferase [Pseudomonadota bacterium]
MTAATLDAPLQLLCLGAEQFETYRPGLVALLLDAVRNGASVGFLADLDRPQAEAYFDRVSAGLAEGSLRLWLVHEQERVLGSVQLSLCVKANGLNRAEIQKLLVLQDARRRGIARRLMQGLEAQAGTLQRGLLYLDTEAGSPAEAFYQALGYQRAGEIPDYAAGPDGVYRPTALYFKLLRRPA